MSYDNSLTGALFKNERKEKPSHPDYNGSATMEDGSEYWLSGWIKESKKDGKKYLSLSFKRKDAPAQKPASKPPQQPAKTPPPRDPDLDAEEESDPPF